MCDYSLENVASRPATVADRLVSTNFTGTFTRGFAGADDLGTAVCLRPGTEIAFEQAPRFEDPMSHSEQAASGTTARFPAGQPAGPVHASRRARVRRWQHRAGGAPRARTTGDRAAVAGRSGACRAGRDGEAGQRARQRLGA